MKRESWVSSFGRRFKSFFFETYIRANFSNFSKRFHRTETSNVGKSDGAFKRAFLHLRRFDEDAFFYYYIIPL